MLKARAMLPIRRRRNSGRCLARQHSCPPAKQITYYPCMTLTTLQRGELFVCQDGSLVVKRVGRTVDTMRGEVGRLEDGAVVFGRGSAPLGGCPGFGRGSRVGDYAAWLSTSCA
mgnify:CR=1 FL=1